MDPPFIVGRIVRPPYFIDREEEMNRLVHSLGAGSENQVVIGLRRMGKSSLLLNVGEAIARKYPDTLLVLLDCRRVTSTASFADLLITGVLEAYERRHPAAGWMQLKRRLLTDAVSELVGEIGKVGGSVGEAFTWYVQLREKTLDPKAFLERAFRFLEAFSRERPERYAIVLDEFQELDKLNEPQTFQLFKSYSDRLDKVRFAFSGSTVTVLRDIFLAPDSPLYLMAGKTPLDPLPKPIVATFVRQRLKAAQMVIDDDALEAVFERTRGVPFYVQKIGLNCWLLCLQRHDTRITLADVDQAFEDMLWELSAEYETRFEHKYGAAQKAILIELSRSGTVQRTELAERVSRPSEQISASLTALENAMEIEKPARGAYRMADPVFAAWVRKRLS